MPSAPSVRALPGSPIRLISVRWPGCGKVGGQPEDLLRARRAQVGAADVEDAQARAAGRMHPAQLKLTGCTPPASRAVLRSVSSCRSTGVGTTRHRLLSALRRLELVDRGRAARRRQHPGGRGSRARARRSLPAPHGDGGAILLPRSQCGRRGGDERVAAVSRLRLPAGARPARALFRRPSRGRGRNRLGRRTRPGLLELPARALCGLAAMLDSSFLSEVHDQPIGVTANLLVRRNAWEVVGGFQEGIRSHGDSEFCWRVQDAGWRLVHVEDAPVEHAHRETLRALFRQRARYGAGAAWLNRHRPRSCPTPRPIRGLARCAGGVIVSGVTLQFERAAFTAIDAVTIIAADLWRTCSATRLLLRAPWAVASRPVRRHGWMHPAPSSWSTAFRSSRRPSSSRRFAP